MLKPSRAESSAQSRATPQQGSQRFRLVLADDHPEVREQIRQLLEPEFHVVLVVEEGAALVRATAELKPDAVVSDVQMPHLDGIEAGRQLLRGGFCAAIVVLSMHSDLHLVDTALQAGIRGYVLKLDANEELIPAVYAALRGERYLSRGVRDKCGNNIL